MAAGPRINKHVGFVVIGYQSKRRQPSIQCTITLDRPKRKVVVPIAKTTRNDPIGSLDAQANHRIINALKTVQFNSNSYAVAELNIADWAAIGTKNLQTHHL